MSLFLNGNQLSGSIPPELGNLSNLDDLFLYDNLLSGRIPPELGNLASLSYLYLNDNQLSGSIPQELGNLGGLQRLLLAGNQLSGTIPAQLGSLNSLRYTYLEDNQLSGPLPAELTDLGSLQDGASNFCNNQLYTGNAVLRAFLDSKQIGGDWEGCQAASVPGLSVVGMGVLFALLMGVALASVRRAEMALVPASSRLRTSAPPARDRSSN